MKQRACILLAAFFAAILPLHGDAEQPPMSENIRLIVGESEKTDYRSRLLAARQLGLQLGASDVERLLLFLDKYLEEDVLSLTQLNAVKNDVTTRLLQQDRPPAELAASLVEGFQRESMDLVWRDYCLQFLPGSFAAFPEARGEILRTLWAAVEVRESTFAGTALLSLRTIQRRHPEAVDAEELASRAFAVAQREDVSTPSRITAVQVAGKDSRIPELAREVLRNPENDVMLRVSAIAVLGNSSNADDQEMLREWINSPDVRLRLAARAAVE